MRIKLLFLIAICAITTIKAQTTRTVNSEATFLTALADSSSGDTIEWANGTYPDVFMDINVDGITVKAETSGDVIFNEASRIMISGDNVTFDGFQFLNGDILDETEGTVENTVITIDGSYSHVSNINISGYTCQKYLRIRDVSQYSEISYCNFENRANYADQNILQIDVSASQSGFHNLNHCTFKNFTGDPDSEGGDDGVEPIRIGSSGQAGYSSKTVVEYCYFTSCEGDGEIISHKATDCIYRYNTFEGNEISELVLRHGDNAIVYGNFFINSTRGIRVREGSGHLIYNNYFGNLSSKSIHLVNSNSDPVDNIIIAYNTIVDSQRIRLSDGALTDGEVLPAEISLLNNIFSNPKSGSGLFRDATGNETWVGNIVDSSDDLGITLPASGISYEDPQLSLNTESLYEIASSSPAVNASTADDLFPFDVITGFAYDNEVLLDVLGSDRPASDTMKDVGCQEYDGTTLLQAHVSDENTGPDYLREDDSLSTSNEEFITKNFNLYPNPLVGNAININFSLDKESAVKVDVFDLSGKKLATLIDASYQSGNQTLHSSLNLGSGIYLLYIKVSSNGTTASKVEKILKQ